LVDLAAGLAKPLDVRGRQPGDLLVLRGDERGPVEARAVDRPALTARIVERAADLARVDEQLLGHAAADHAGAAPPIRFSDRAASAVLGRDGGRTNASGAAADDEQVDVEACHWPHDRTRHLEVPPVDQTCTATGTFGFHCLAGPVN